MATSISSSVRRPAPEHKRCGKTGTEAPAGPAHRGGAVARPEFIQRWEFDIDDEVVVVSGPFKGRRARVVDELDETSYALEETDGGPEIDRMIDAKDLRPA